MQNTFIFLSRPCLSPSLHFFLPNVSPSIHETLSLEAKKEMEGGTDIVLCSTLRNTLLLENTYIYNNNIIIIVNLRDY